MLIEWLGGVLQIFGRPAHVATKWSRRMIRG
jgi:hypothetical protein